MTFHPETSTSGEVGTDASTPPAMRTPRRYVTGHDAQGQALISHEGAAPLQIAIDAIPGTVFHEIWCTQGSPAVLDNSADPICPPLRLGPPPSGSRIRIVDIPPDTTEFLRRGAERMAAAFTQIGDAHASTVAADSPHPLMHRTETLDYGIVLEGEVILILDREERRLLPGDIVVQRGTNHAWANRTTGMSRMAFILLDGRYAAEAGTTECGS